MSNTAKRGPEQRSRGYKVKAKANPKLVVKMERKGVAWLRRHSACSSGFKWATTSCATLTEAWNKCTRPTWLVWLLVETQPVSFWEIRRVCDCDLLNFPGTDRYPVDRAHCNRIRKLYKNPFAKTAKGAKK